MLNLYIFAAVIGAGLVLVNLLMGGHGHDTDAHGDVGGHHGDADGQGDTDSHSDGEGHTHSHAWIPFLSLRFWTYFFAGFGLIGLALTFFAPTVKEPAVAVWSSIGGLLTGLAVATMMRFASRFETDSNMREEDLLGREGKVTVAIRPNSIGKVQARLRGELLELTALLQENGETIEVGEPVIIVAMESEKAVVMPRQALFGSEQNELPASHN